MKEIKFRAWDGDRTYMPSDEDTYIKLVNGEIRSPGIILEQYTGLKDKNKKEAYHNDLFIHPARNGSYPIQIVWHRNGWYGVYNGLFFPLYYDELSCSEIIGNIHENPELL